MVTQTKTLQFPDVRTTSQQNNNGNKHFRSSKWWPTSFLNVRKKRLVDLVRLDSLCPPHAVVIYFMPSLNKLFDFLQNNQAFLNFFLSWFNMENRYTCSFEQQAWPGGGHRSPWPSQIFGIFSHFVLWEAVFQIKYYCSPKIKKFGPLTPRATRGCHWNLGLLKATRLLLRSTDKLHLPHSMINDQRAMFPRTNTKSRNSWGW